MLPRLGALLGVQPVADVTRVVDPGTYVRCVLSSLRHNQADGNSHAH